MMRHVENVQLPAITSTVLVHTKHYLYMGAPLPDQSDQIRPS